MDRLTSMAVFVKAADLGSFAAAAEALGLSGPMVGKHVRFLEERLGARLIHRTTRRQSLTEFGKAYYERCRIVLAEADAADALVADQLKEPRGRLRVTMPMHFGRRCVTPVLLELARQHPGLQLDLSYSDRIVDLVEDGYDLAIRTGSLDDRAGVIARRVARQCMTVCASPQYIERHGAPGSLDDLARHRAVLYHRTGPQPPWLFPRKDGPPAQVFPAAGLRVDDLEAAADAAAAGAGPAWLPSWLVRDRIRSGELVELLTGTPGYLYDAFALWTQTPYMPPKLRVAIDALAAQLPGYMICDETVLSAAGSDSD
ncbi:LysR family transcriptional regulator [Roseibium salinum]|uniref:LysR family transcriptional regulator n=1 Tax=Roseibium salinum TaxID=1604349 RepID=A0ABT3QXW1_9HYPH|nr:LysR family transcriptional regulator [Roseibium sp. DSM 29163]MCX2721782.1 LysR family transcriptional regulator [Roseibium sp. DSM 29163]MDN3720173.1 LysR family transcriptional regulator [Roseibium salinum]